MDRTKTAATKPANEVSLAKARLGASAATFAPRELVRRNPLMGVGVAFTTGLALSKMPRTREVLMRSLDLGVSLLLKLVTSPLRMACAKPKEPEPCKNPERQRVQ